MSDAIPVVFCFDANYANYAAVATYSLHQNTSSALNIYWIIPAEEKDDIVPIQQILLQRGLQIRLLCADTSMFSDWKVVGHFSRGMYLRLLIPDLLSERKAIYLDSDTLVLGDLTELYESDMQQNLIGGVIDINEGINSKIPRSDGDIYINSGVLVMDLDALRADRFLKKCTEIYRQYAQLTILPDQCVINKYADGKKLILDPGWNRQIIHNNTSKELWRQIIAGGHSKVLHFITDTKPWQTWCLPYLSEFWWSYANQLALPGLKPAEATELTHFICLAKAYDQTGDFGKASRLKSDIIRTLLKAVVDLSSAECA